MSRHYATPDWTSQDEREHVALRERFLASSTRRRLNLERMRERRQESLNERRRLFDDAMEDNHFALDVPSQDSDVTVSY